MCGIIGYCGSKQAQPILLDGLQKLEYRGYDSVGIVCSTKTQHGLKQELFHVCKEVGKVAELARLCHENPIEGTSGVGHCRWATHGAVNWENAHPHKSTNEKVVLVHNGIIENYLELKQKLITKGFTFDSESDTEIIANLLEYFITSDEVELLGQDFLGINSRAMLTLRKWLKGSYALAVMFESEPDNIYAIRHESPLVVGKDNHELLIASDIIPLSGYVNQIYYLDNHELAYLSINDKDVRTLQVFHPDGAEREIEFQELNLSIEDIDKQGYQHFMLKEIHEQPAIFANLYSTFIDENSLPTKFEFDDAHKAIIQNCKRVIFVSCGTSYHATMYGANIFERFLHLNASVEYASEFRYRHPNIDEDCLIIALSQSGETADTLGALQLAKQKNARTLGIVNVPTSSIARMVDIMLCTNCGPEIGVASTKAYTAQLLLLYYLMLAIGTIRDTLPKEQIITLVEKSKLLPQISEKLLTKNNILIELGRAYAGYQHILYLGRGLMYSVALEGALKLKEISYIHAEGYAAAEMKHGPIALIDSAMPIVILAPNHDIIYDKILSNIAEVKARGGRVLSLVTEGEEGDFLGDDIFHVPNLSELLDAILFAIPLQLLAYHTAVARGTNPDQPRNLAKSVTVE